MKTLLVRMAREWKSHASRDEKIVEMAANFGKASREGCACWKADIGTVRDALLVEGLVTVNRNMNRERFDASTFQE